MYATLNRFKKLPESTLGNFYVHENEKKIFECKSLELPDKNNQQRVSCIPEGEYNCLWTFSPSFKKFTYELRNVKGRTGIRIHSANFAMKQLRGCISLGKEHTDIDKDGTIDITESKKNIEAFEKLMNGQTFKLKIIYEQK